MLDEDSPYPEVRASVSNIDDPSMPVLTFRSWFLGIFLSLAGVGGNVYFNYRYPAPAIYPMVLLLVAHPLGKFMAYSLPIESWWLRIPGWLWEINLNPGPFNIKEHVIIYMMTNASVAPAYALNPTVVAEKYYGIQLGLGFNFLIVIGTQCIGLGIAGMCRRFLVWPASLIWPQNLVACTLLNTLHAEDDEPSSRGGITRHQMFMWGVVGAFVWSWFPSYIFQALSVFSWVCWWKPNNVVINQLFGVYSGLGMGVLSFDWNQIAFIGSPMMVPWWAVVQIFIGFVTIYWLVLPLLYYNDVWHFASFPMMANSPFDRFGAEYNISRVINTADHTFNQTAYDGYSPLYLPANYAMTYLLAFTLTTCIITHTLLYHGKDLMNGLKRMKMEEDDIHAKLMRYYPEVPDWWYGSIFFGSLILGLITLAAFNTGVPLWGLIVAILVPVIYIVPVGFVYAFTAQSVSTNLISESLAGLLFPGRPLTNMIFKAYATQTQIVGQYIVQDLKLGHYIKIPPRATFMAQGVAVFITAVAQVGIQHALFLGVKDICAPNQSAHLTCPHTQVFYSASVIWGLIGPTRQFGAHALYKPELYALAFGAVLPIPLWLWQKRYPRSILSDVSTPVILTGPSAIPPALGINYSSWFAVAVIFQYFVRRKNFRWWSKFNYILSSAMDSGTSIGAIVIFLTLQLPKGGNLAINWWGNNVFLNSTSFLPCVTSWA
ncbi:OPT oligopeptide transporter [Clavulina sp. PMI_390]|nr:OPT oligopeptide transporter [Clavulina sp. PMI_390]